MFRKLGAVVATATLTLSIGVLTVPVASASSDPTPPSVTLTAATCSAPNNTIKVTGLDVFESNGHRLVIELNDSPIKQIKTSLRKELSKEPQTAESLFSPAELQVAYGKKVVIKSYWFNTKKNKLDHLVGREATVDLQVGDDLTNAVQLGSSNEITLVDPASLNCAPPAPAPKDSIADIKVPTITLTAAMCEANKATDNVMTFKGDKAENYRFVATYDGKKVSLNTALRKQLFDNGKLSASDIKAAYPALTFDYSKPLTVQTYWFDAEKAYAPALYDTDLKLTVGQSDRFIKLDKAQTITLVDITTLDCKKPQPSADNHTSVTPDVQKPAADTKAPGKPTNALTAAKTGFESGVLAIVALLSAGAAAAGLIVSRARR